MKKILIVDDEVKLRGLLSRIIGLEGFEVFEAGDFKSAYKQLERQEIDVVLCDVRLPDGNGIDEITTIKGKQPLAEIILLTAYGNIPDGVQAIKNGAFDYIVKGEDNNRIVPLLHRALEKVALSKRVVFLEKQLGHAHSFNSIIGRSAQILQAIELAKKVAPTDTTVLLTGETGTGKEVFAQAIHQASPRSQKNFVALNCAAFSKDLLESELFGHRAGAFTGAMRDQKGLMEEAHNGTLFLDEIGEMPFELQAKLLRVLETGAFFKIGDNKAQQVNIRLITATNRDLPAEIERHQFREDLFYRISVFQIPLPALRERTADIEPLALHFLQLFAAKTNKKMTGFSPACLEALRRHPWQGNIRELKNVIERSVILSDSGIITEADLPLEFRRPAQPGSLDRPTALDLASAEKRHIQEVLHHTHGNKTRAAELLQIALTTLYRKISEYGIE